MTTQSPSPSPSSLPRAGERRPPPKWDFSLAIQLVLSLAVAVGVFAYLLLASGAHKGENESHPAKPEEVVGIDGPRTIRIRPGTPLDKKLTVGKVEATWLTTPILPVTGTTLASLRPGAEYANDAWQFATSDLLSAFSDWQKAVLDIQFQETQRTAIVELNESRVDSQTKLVARMKRLVKAGTDTEKDLAAEETNLKQFEVQGRKEIHEAETAVKIARRTEATLSRQLQQAGLDPTMLRSNASEGDIVVAEVPERTMSLVKIGMECQVRFFGLPDRVFNGRVSSLSPVISKDKRVLNVQFVVKDPDNAVRPGMFAEIGLGTDKRRALLMPADGVLHVGEKDYALLQKAPEIWEIAEVQTGELRGTRVEVLSGLKEGDRVMGQGAILLKPIVANALQESSEKTPAETKGGSR